MRLDKTAGRTIEEQFISTLADGLKPRERVDLYKWAREWRRNDKGLRFEFEKRLYLRQVYEEAGSHKTEVIKKAAQTGGTEYAISRALQFAILESPVTIIYTFPSATEVRQFVTSRMNPSIVKSPKIRELIGTADSVSVKEIAGSFIHFRGSFSEREPLSVPSDLNIHDELDFSNPYIISQYQERLTASRHGYRLYFSTPTVPKYGIDALYEQSDQHEWLLDCPCGWSGFPNIEKFSRNKDSFLCPKCDAKLNRQKGHWEAMNPSSDVRGWHFDQVTSYFVPVISILDKLDGPNAYSKKNFQNLVRGQACSIGVGLVNRGVILRNCFTDAIEQSKRGYGRYMGIDQNEHMTVVVSEVREGKRSIVELKEVKDDDEWSEMHRLMAVHGVNTCVIDYRPETRLARAFANQYPGKVFCCEFVTTDKELFFDREEEYLVKGSRSEILDGTAEQITKGETQLYTPDEEVEKYIQHWEALSRTEEEDHLGRPKIKWVKTSDACHYPFADAYNRLAVMIDRGIGMTVEGMSELADTLEREENSFFEEKW